MKLKTFIPHLLVLLAATVLHGETNSEQVVPSDIRWGKAIRGVQLGISYETDEFLVADGLRFRVHLRNATMSRVRLLPSVHSCLAVGPGAAILVSKLELKPESGGETLIVTYSGSNHAAEPDGSVNFQAHDEEFLSTTLLPGQITRGQLVEFTTGNGSETNWSLANKTKKLPAGRYKVTAFFTVDQKLSKWKGELRSATLPILVSR